MHAGNLIELAARLALDAEHFRSIPSDKLLKTDEFWSLSKEKVDHWVQQLEVFRTDLQDGSIGHDRWTAIACVVEEILCCEFFVRIAAAFMVYSDQPFDAAKNGPVGRSVFLFHLEARLRALELIETGLEQKASEARRLNELRRRLESWCDLLLGFFPGDIAYEFSVDCSRNREFERDIAEESPSSRKNVERLLLISIREHVRSLNQGPSANPTLNRQFADLFSFLDQSQPTPGQSFNGHSIQDLTNEAERWIDSYLSVR